jgi:4-hydroxybenzoate polyprenyltransferase
MVHPYLINTLNALVLLIAGLILYFTHPARPPMALLAPFLGILLLACTYHLRKHNRFVFNTVSALTLLAGLLMIWQIEPEGFVWSLQHVLLLLMGLSSFVAVAFYVGTFVQERRMRNNSIYKDDL